MIPEGESNPPPDTSFSTGPQEPGRSYIGEVVAGSLAAGFAAAVILAFLPVGTVNEDFSTAMC